MALQLFRVHFRVTLKLIQNISNVKFTILRTTIAVIFIYSYLFKTISSTFHVITNNSKECESSLHFTLSTPFYIVIIYYKRHSLVAHLTPRFSLSYWRPPKKQNFPFLGTAPHSKCNTTSSLRSARVYRSVCNIAL